MWWTDRGEQILRGAELALFCAGLYDLWDWVEGSLAGRHPFDTGVRPFDRLQPNQQLAMLALVGRALRDEGEPCPPLTMNTEAAVAAVFQHICNQVDEEVYMAEDQAEVEDPTGWRTRVLEAYRAARADGGWEDWAADVAQGDPAGGGAGSGGGADDEDEGDDVFTPPVAASTDLSDWEFVVLELLADRILWCDGDFLMDARFMDADPAWARRRMEQMGIDPNYYLDVAPDPTDGELEQVRRTLRAVCGDPGPRTG